MKFLILALQRLAILGLGAFSIWLIIYVFGWVDRGLPPILALSLTYALAAYVILPYAVRMRLRILRHKHVKIEAETVNQYVSDGDGAVARLR